METEVHVYAFSMAANVLLSFYPFLLVMVSFCRHVLGWESAEQAIYVALKDYYPGQIGEFIERNLKASLMGGPLQITSLLLLLFTANGIFEPLEVALNRAWGIGKNRSFFRNQLVSLGLIFTCGGLALISMLLTALNQELWRQLGFAGAHLTLWTNLALFKMAAVPVSILALVLVYWLLPNGHVSLRSLIPVSIMVGVLLEVLKYLNLLVWPFLRIKLEREYGPFVYSVTIVLWAFLASMVVLAGADWAARTARALALQSNSEVDTVVVGTS
ncbi:MAG: YihY/virulence factor BrkB family protein [Bryobacterales bacterium]|nr:YihY/virulence factor BrkB family protein [Bryobacterales bacterium]